MYPYHKLTDTQRENHPSLRVVYFVSHLVCHLDEMVPARAEGMRLEVQYCIFEANFDLTKPRFF